LSHGGVFQNDEVAVISAIHEFRIAEANVTVSPNDPDTVTDTVARELYRSHDESIELQ